MSGEINVISRTQTIVVEPSSGTVSVISAGPQGPAGVGIPPGGTTGQVLVKVSNADGDVAWATPS